jgi:hypothetical protein
MSTTRFVSSLVLGVLGGFVVVASQVFAPATVAWLAFALGIVALALVGLPALAGERSIPVLAADTAVGLLAAWTIVASLVFAGSTVVWLSFAEALGLVGAALGGLILTYVRLYRASTVATGLDLRGAASLDSRRTPVAA